jgi:O-antigen/teichoic acid export membrane protein
LGKLPVLRPAGSRLRRLASDRLVRNNLIFLTGSIGAGAFGYVYHFAVGRLTGPAAYSVVAAAVGAASLLTLPGLVLQLIAARFTSVAAAREQLGPVRRLVRLLSGLSLGLGLAVAAVILVAGPGLAQFLQLHDRTVVALLSASALLGMLVSVNRGVLQGLLRFGSLSANLILDGAGRVGIAVALVLGGFGPAGAVAGLLAGPTIAYAQSLTLLRRLPRAGAQAGASLRQVGRYAAPAATAVIGVTYLYNVDVILARHYLPSREAGIYAAGAVLARVTYFLGVTIAGVMFPEVAGLHARDQAHYRVVDVSLLFLGVVGVCLIGVYALLPALVLLPYGAQFDPVRPYLGTFAAALTLLALSNLLVNYFLSVNSGRFILPLLLAGLAETGLMLVFHQGLWQLLLVLVGCNLGLTASLAGLYAIERVYTSP